jgi:two-component system capsular synthesis sensor histidine kinase RcsC
MQLAHVIGEVCDLQRIHAQDKGLELQVRLDDRLPADIMSDPGRLRQVLHNLVGNAIKFTEQGRVSISVLVVDVTEEDASLKLVVSDTGPGIPPSELDLIFEPFHRGAATLDSGGTGLGLSITRELVRRLGGDLSVESTVGKGSAFQVRMKVPLPQAFTGASPTEQGPVEKLNKSTGQSRFSAHVLVAEDDPVNQMVALTMLQHLGCTVTTVRDGEEALRRINTEPFDLVLMDCRMPNLDGLKTTQRLRQLPPPLSSTPVVALSANAGTEEKARCLQAGMNDYLAKPLNLEDLQNALWRWAPQGADAGERSSPT